MSKAFYKTVEILPPLSFFFDLFIAFFAFTPHEELKSLSKNVLYLEQRQVGGRSVRYLFLAPLDHPLWRWVWM
jgi:hypothetical protein